MSGPFWTGVRTGLIYGLVVAGSWAMLYGLSAFVCWDLNPAHWPAGLRALDGLIGLVAAVALIADMRDCRTLA